MKKLYLALLFVLMAVVARAQVTYAPGGINYGHGMVVQETSGTGTPNPLTCSGFARYWQTDASVSPMWECLGGTMVNVGGSSTQGGTSFAVTTTATGLQSLSGPLQIPNINVGSSDTNIFRCGAACLAVGSVAGSVNGVFQAFSFTGNINGVLVATNYSGSDIGAKVNAAYATCSASVACEVDIPAGTYNYSTSIVMPNSATTTLKMNAGVTLNYTGSSYAIKTSQGPAWGGGTYQGFYVIRGGLIFGTSSAKGGVLMAPATSGIEVSGVSVDAFTNGDGFLDVGSDSVKIADSKSLGNLVGIHLMASPAHASNNVLVERTDIVGNKWGVINGDVSNWSSPWTFTGTTGVASPNFNNTFFMDTFEGNTIGAAIEGLTTGSEYLDNYVEGNPRGIVLGMVELPITSAQYSSLYGISGSNGGSSDGTSVNHNFFTTGSSMHSLVELRAAGNSILTGNTTNGSPTPCFFDLYTGSNSWVGQNDQQNVTALLCQGGSPGWSIPNTIPTNLIVQGTLQAGSTSLGVLTQNGLVTLNSSATITGGGSGPQILKIGQIVVYSTSVVPSGSCSAGSLDIGTFGLAVCKNGTWATF